jgi:hypothetical protein
LGNAVLLPSLLALVVWVSKAHWCPAELLHPLLLRLQLPPLLQGHQVLMYTQL